MQESPLIRAIDVVRKMEETGGKERKGESVGGPVRSQWRIIQGYWTLLVGNKPVLAHCLPPNWSQ